MKEFIARFGYTLAFAIGIPKYTLEEAFEEWFKFGLLALVSGALAVLIGLVGIIILLKKDRQQWKAKQN